jgi:nitrite reductase/ring-hydroxylating ferredoxin subunit
LVAKPAVPPQQRSRATLAGVLLAGAAAAVAIGVYAPVHHPASRPLFLLGFSGMLQLKAWLATAVLLLVVVQVLTALWMWRRLPGVGRPPVAAGRRWPMPTAHTGDGGRMLVALDRVPVGGGVILGKEKVAVNRPAPDHVRAFSAVCTHQGCTVDTVTDGTIDCLCHGSSFDAATRAVRLGPAARPLPTVAVVVRSGEVIAS